MAGIYRKVAGGSVVAANIAVTLTAGSADVDLSSATIPRNYRGHLLKIYDSSNRMIQGYVYTDGAGTVQNIVSAKGGTTQNWASQAAGFDDTTNCTYEIFKVNTAVVVASGAIAVNEMLADTTAVNAFAAPVGVDLSAYQDGNHMLWLQDSTGRVAFGHISATAPAGETLGAEILPNTAFDNTTGVTATGYCQIASIAGGQAGNCLEITNGPWAGGGNVHEGQALLSTGKLYIKSAYYKAGSPSQNSVADGVYNDTVMGWRFYNIVTLTGSWVQLTPRYFTAMANDDFWMIGAHGSGTIGDIALLDTATLKQVTAPAATGALIVSAQGGATRAWAYKHASFDPNANGTYKVLFIGD